MLTYEYHCPTNGQTLRVRHSIKEKLLTWGELIERSGIEIENDATPADTPIRRNILGGQLVHKKKDFLKYEPGSTGRPCTHHHEDCGCH